MSRMRGDERKKEAHARTEACKSRIERAGAPSARETGGTAHDRPTKSAACSDHLEGSRREKPCRDCAGTEHLHRYGDPVAGTLVSPSRYRVGRSERRGAAGGLTAPWCTVSVECRPGVPDGADGV